MTCLISFSRDVFIVPVVNGLTSFYAGLVTFSIVGFVAKEKGMTVENVFRQGIYANDQYIICAVPAWTVQNY